MGKNADSINEYFKESRNNNSAKKVTLNDPKTFLYLICNLSKL